MREVIIYGAGPFARMMRHYLDKVHGQKVVAFCVDRNFLGDQLSISGLPVVPFEDVEFLYPANRYFMLVAVGYSNMRARKKMYDASKSKDYRLINYIDSSSTVDETVSIGYNNIVLAGSIIEPFARLGDNNIIWSSVVISHNADIQSHCFLASQALIGGNSVIESGCFFGFNSTCSHDLVVSRESLIGAHSLVLADTLEFSRNIGSPSRAVSFHMERGIFVK